MRAIFFVELDVGLAERHIQIISETGNAKAFAGVIREKVGGIIFRAASDPVEEQRIRSLILYMLLRQPLNPQSRRELSPQLIRSIDSKQEIDQMFLESIIGDFASVAPDCRVHLLDGIVDNEAEQQRYLASRSLHKL